MRRGGLGNKKVLYADDTVLGTEPRHSTGLKINAWKNEVLIVRRNLRGVVIT